MLHNVWGEGVWCYYTNAPTSSSQLYFWSKTTQGISFGVPSEAETTHFYRENLI